LGSVLYAMCAGRPPFQADSTAEVLRRVYGDRAPSLAEANPNVPEWLCDAIARLHAKEPRDRFGSAQEVADLLGEHLAALQQSPGPHPDRRPAATPHPSRRNYLILGVLLVALLSAGLATALLWPWLRRPAPDLDDD